MDRRHRFAAAVVGGLAFLLISPAGADEPDTPLDSQKSAVSAPAIRAAIEKSLPLLTKAAVGHREQRKQCFACHNQGVPIFALTAAKARGCSQQEQILGLCQ